MGATNTAEQLIRDLIAGSAGATGAILEAARTSQDPSVLVAAALVAPGGSLLGRAAASATDLRERQLVAVATAHLRGDDDRALVLARDHLAEHPDSLLVAHIAALAAQHRPPDSPQQTRNRSS